jgi:hypothetical protein
MLAYKSRIGIVTRVLLIAVVVFNALIPVPALAKSSSVSRSEFKAERPGNPSKVNTNGSLEALPDYTPPSVCWVKHWNGQGSTEWRITNPNPVPLSTNPDTKLRYNWKVYSAFDAGGSVLQSAQAWDNPNPNPVNTVYSQSMKL